MDVYNTDFEWPQGTEITYSYVGELYWEQGNLGLAERALDEAKSLDMLDKQNLLIDQY